MTTQCCWGGRRAVFTKKWGGGIFVLSPEILLFSFFSVAHSRPTLYNPMDCSTPGSPVLQHLPESAQIQVHGVGNAIQPSHPLPPLLLLFSVFPSIRVFSSESVLRMRWPKYPSFSFSISPFNEYSGLISFRTDWSDLLTVQGTLKSSPAPQFESVRTKCWGQKECSVGRPHTGKNPECLSNRRESNLRVDLTQGHLPILTS